MRSSARRAGRPLKRRARLLLGRNELRRPADRIEGLVAAVLTAAFLTAAVAAVFFAGHIYQFQRASAAHVRPTGAVLTQPGPVPGSHTATVRATWRLPNGTRRSGTLTAAAAPGIYYAPARASVSVWLNRSGQPQAAPPTPADVVFNAVADGIAATAGAALALTLCYLFCRIVLDRLRLAKWETAWAAVGPRWTSRR
jgi:hypothetical protein